MFGSGDFWDESPLWFLKTFKLPSFYLGNFKIFKKALGQYIPNRPRVFVRNDFTCKVIIFRYLYDFSSFWSALVSLKNGSNSSTIVVGGNRHILKYWKYDSSFSLLLIDQSDLFNVSLSVDRISLFLFRLFTFWIIWIPQRLFHSRNFLRVHQSPGLKFGQRLAEGAAQRYS